MKFKNLLVLLFSIFLVGCNSDFPKVSVRNNSEQKIDSVQIGMSQKFPTTFKNILPNEQVHGTISAEDDSLGDGAYYIEVYFEDTTSKKETFGYFTNGTALEYCIAIEIKQDIILVDYFSEE